MNIINSIKNACRTIVNVIDSNSIVINGDAKEVFSASGDITVKGSVEKDVHTTSGDIDVSGDVEGNVSSVSGDIIANTIKGNTSTVSGNIRKRH